MFRKALGWMIEPERILGRFSKKQISHPIFRNLFGAFLKQADIIKGISN